MGGFHKEKKEEVSLQLCSVCCPAAAISFYKQSKKNKVKKAAVWDYRHICKMLHVWVFLPPLNAV